jgi:hypothetical protein
MAYPVTNNNVPLSNSVLVSTTVALQGAQQVATVVFSTAAGVLGTVTLSPMQPQYSNLVIGAGLQKVNLSLIAFTAAFGITQGSVAAAGNATDQSGNNPVNFSLAICTWSGS